jgi:hypothetical protein
MLEEYGSTKGNFMADEQSRMRLALENLLMIIGRLQIANQRTFLERIKEVK